MIIGFPADDDKARTAMMNRGTASVFSNSFRAGQKYIRTGVRANRTCKHAPASAPRVRRAYLHDFFALAFYFFPPPARRPLPPRSRVCKPVSCLAHSLTTNFVNGFHSGGFSRSCRAISGASSVRSLFLPFSLPPFAALIARASPIATFFGKSF